MRKKSKTPQEGYCDSKTTKSLKSLGFDWDSEITLVDAIEWIRTTKGIYIGVSQLGTKVYYDKNHKKQVEYKWAHYLRECETNRPIFPRRLIIYWYDTEEESMLRGIKEAIKIMNKSPMYYLDSKLKYA